MKTNIFDVLIVYSEAQAESASDSAVNFPFDPENGNAIYSDVYKYFLQVCRKNKLKTAFTTSADIIGAGLCSSYWLIEEGQWTKVREPGYAKLIFDKLSPKTAKLAKQRNLLFSTDKVKPFNNPRIRKLFFDKHKTYQELKHASIPTVLIDGNSLESLEKACSELEALRENHRHTHDFSESIILKDRFGAGGFNIYKFKKNQLNKMHQVIKKNAHQSFVIQPFTKFDEGYRFNEKPVSADIRLVFLRGKIVQTYIRMAQNDSFLCNEHSGGLLKYISLNEIPKQVLSQAKKIAGKLNWNDSLFSLDFIVSNHGNAYLLEGNTGPGLDWNPNIEKNIIKSKEFITMITHDLVRRSVAQQS